PNLDALAAESIRYTNAHSMAPVCSVSRAAIITGVASFALGTHHHRSRVAAPAHLRLLPAYLRDAGYFTSNCVKTDYNLAGTGNPHTEAEVPIMAEAWNAWSGEAHWRQRNPGQPFFSVFNYTECHSSVTWDRKEPIETIRAERLTLLQPEDFHDPDQAPPPPFHPDIPEFRRAWADYYDAITQIDYHVGRHVAELQEDGVWDDTIVVFWADHGTGMLRAKHWGWEQGDHVPLIVRFPPRWQHLAPAAPGAVVDEPVTTMDLAASTLTMTGLPVPDYMHSRPVLCAGAEHRPHVVTGRDRLDTRFELIRSLRARHFRYQRNFFPHLPYFPYETSIYWSGYIHAWDRLARAGELVGAQRQIAAQRKPFEELYDGAADPWFVDDLVPAGEHAELVDEMRRQLYDWMIEHRDLGLIDEPELHERAAGGPLWLVGRQCGNYEEILDTADLSRRGVGQRVELLRRLA
ncbi:MAG: sulfatase-like hydrolase/transferase, partial [Spirochaetaceae bacterium]|nr:sulfatase-like hydrolase/transferase [Spirochaetaceae bacterium]